MTVFQSCPESFDVSSSVDSQLTLLTREEGVSPDIIVYPESWLRIVLEGEISEHTEFKKFSEVMKNHKVSALLGTCTEYEKNKKYVTSVLIGSDGKICGKYRKRKPTSHGAHDEGSTIGIFDLQTSKGQVNTAVMICFDIENQDIFNETMESKPQLLLNPTWIPSTTNKKDRIRSDWRIGSASFFSLLIAKTKLFSKQEWKL